MGHDLTALGVGEYGTKTDQLWLIHFMESFSKGRQEILFKLMFLILAEQQMHLQQLFENCAIVESRLGDGFRLFIRGIE